MESGINLLFACVSIPRPCRQITFDRKNIWPRGPMDKASAYGAGDCRFESCRGHFVSHLIMVMVAITIDTRLAFATASVASHAELEKKVTTHTDNGSWTCDVRETDASRKDPAHSL